MTINVLRLFRLENESEINLERARGAGHVRHKLQRMVAWELIKVMTERNYCSRTPPLRNLQMKLLLLYCFNSILKDYCQCTEVSFPVSKRVKNKFRFDIILVMSLPNGNEMNENLRMSSFHI